MRKMDAQARGRDFGIGQLRRMRMLQSLHLLGRKCQFQSGGEHDNDARYPAVIADRHHAREQGFLACGPLIGYFKFTISTVHPSASIRGKDAPDLYPACLLSLRLPYEKTQSSLAILVVHMDS